MRHQTVTPFEAFSTATRPAVPTLAVVRGLTQRDDTEVTAIDALHALRTVLDAWSDATIGPGVSRIDAHLAIMDAIGARCSA